MILLSRTAEFQGASGRLPWLRRACPSATLDESDVVVLRQQRLSSQPRKNLYQQHSELQQFPTQPKLQLILARGQPNLLMKRLGESALVTKAQIFAHFRYLLRADL